MVERTAGATSTGLGEQSGDSAGHVEATDEDPVEAADTTARSLLERLLGRNRPHRLCFLDSGIHRDHPLPQVQPRQVYQVGLSGGWSSGREPSPDSSLQPSYSQTKVIGKSIGVMAVDGLQPRMSSMSHPIDAVREAVAEQEHVQPTDLPAVAEYVDAKTLDALTGSWADLTDDLSFTYVSYPVTVHPTGIVTIVD